MNGRGRHPTWLLFAAAAVGLIALIGRGLAPMLLTKSPLLLLALSPIPAHLVLAATVAPMVPFIVVATLRGLLTPLLAYYIGRHYGPDGITFIHGRYPRWSRLLGFIERSFDRAAPLLLLVLPEPSMCALAGARLFNPWIAAAMVVAGQTIRVSLIFHVGDALSAWLLPFMDWLRGNVWTATLICALLAMAYGFSRRRSQKRMITGLDGIDGAERGSTPPPQTPASSER
jgi:hypothetical protein